MSISCLRRFRLGKLPTVATLPLFTPRRNLHATARNQDAALDVSAASLPSTSTPAIEHKSPGDYVMEQKKADLEAAVKGARGDYNRAWGCYIDLLNFVGPDQIPLELHQRVLRRCSLGPAESRAWLARRLSIGRRPPVSHVHEVRYQSVIHNMRMAGYTPSIDDYHYILRQFAAVGHHAGAIHVLREIRHLGLQRTSKTYGLCLMAMCHRLSLPCWHLDREPLVGEISRLCSMMLKDMWEDGIQVSALNVDFAMRIFKETLDLEGFERLMKIAYGIDLAYPDRPPIEFWGPDRANVPPEDLPLAQPLAFSTASLNTTVDFLGRIGQISRLVQSFEVLTTPLPSSAAPSSTYEDDEDDDFGIANPAVAPYSSPYASPNTTTYYLLLKWLSRAGHAVLARHYLLQASQLDRAVGIALRNDCWHKPRQEILAPHFAVNRRLVLPVFAEANRDKNMELLRWVLVRTQVVLRRKRRAISYYTQTQERWRREDEEKLASRDMSSEFIPSPAQDLTSPRESTPPPSTSSRSLTPENISPDLDTDLDATPLPPPPKVFNIDNHLSILRRDTEELEELERHMNYVLGRNSQRVKERLGRRVWGRQNIYLRTIGHRTLISREAWRGIVNFRPTRLRRTGQTSAEKIRGPPGHIAAWQGFFTSKQYADRLREVPPHIPLPVGTKLD